MHVCMCKIHLLIFSFIIMSSGNKAHAVSIFWDFFLAISIRSLKCSPDTEKGESSVGYTVLCIIYCLYYMYSDSFYNLAVIWLWGLKFYITVVCCHFFIVSNMIQCCVIWCLKVFNFYLHSGFYFLSVKNNLLNVANHLDTQMGKKMKLISTSHHAHLVEDLNVESKIIKPLEDIIREYLHNLRQGNIS